MIDSDGYADKRVLITGSEGFLGRHLQKHLGARGAKVLILHHSEDPRFGGDLQSRDHADTIIANCVREGHLDFVFHLAGYNGGIGFNYACPADIFYSNTVMGLNLLRACAVRSCRIGRVVSMVASCSYPEDFHDEGGEEGVYREQSFLRGRPNEVVACHGYAKRNLQLASLYNNRQYGLRAVCLCPTTLYGPGDSFDPARTKVAGAMVKRMVDARRADAPYVTIWGDGTPLREFLYVDDAARLICDAGLAYGDPSEPLNLGTGQEVSVLGLAQAAAAAAGYRGAIGTDPSRPSGQKRKRLDLTKMDAVLGPPLAPFVGLEEGLRRTAEHYEGTCV